MAQPTARQDGRKNNGGPRPGSGRKPLKRRPTKGHVAVATTLLDKLQPRCVEVIEEALHATKIVGKEEVPDHAVRIKAAELAMRKRIPDLSKVEMTEPDEAKELRDKAKQSADAKPVVEIIRQLAALARRERNRC